MTIPMSPVLNPPRLLRPIPYVPVTTANIPHYNLEAFRAVSSHFYIFLSAFFVNRDFLLDLEKGFAPWYHCRCRICERAALLANAQAAGNSAPPMVTPPQQLFEPKMCAVVVIIIRG